MPAASAPPEHPFVARPHRTLLGMSLPVLLSLVAEPLTGLVDTAFVAALGSEALAGLGVGTTLLSGCFWIFGFLGISTHTEVAKARGAGDRARGGSAYAHASVLAVGFGLLLLVVGEIVSSSAATAMGATGELHADAVLYLRVRLLAAPAVLLTTVAFGALRGAQDMRTPLVIAVALNAMNIALDALLIPRFGIAGAAWATAGSQVAGAAAAVWITLRRIGWVNALERSGFRRLLAVGGDMFVRTGLLTLFLVLTTRAATRAGAEAGAAHQAIRQVWLFTALVLDAFAATAQSLIGWFVGATDTALARRVARVACGWGLATGVALTLAMLLLEDFTAAHLVPPEARAAFAGAWFLAAIFQPLNALSFVTDGVHWGTADFRYLRNAMIAATGLGIVGLATLGALEAEGLAPIWWLTGAWICVRTGFGVLRIWPGIGAAPLRD